MIVKSANPKEIQYDLKRPCKDCPFLVASELHEGVGAALVEYHGFIERGTFAHTCHKTDPRADSEAGKKFRGEPRHCAGALAMQMQEKMDYQRALDFALVNKKCDPEALRNVAGLWPNFVEMVKAYASWMKDGVRAGARGSDYFTDPKP